MLRHVIPQPRVAYRDQVYTCDTHTRMSLALSAGGDCCHAKASNSPGHARNHSYGATSKAPSYSSSRVYPPFVHQPTPISVLSRLLPCSLPRAGCSVFLAHRCPSNLGPAEVSSQLRRTEETTQRWRHGNPLLMPVKQREDLPWCRGVWVRSWGVLVELERGGLRT